jgi:predicted nucleic acid-binding protein
MVELQKRGLRAADALHVATAVEFDADLLVSGDEDILNVDGVITNRSGRVIRCVDSHDALKLLGQDE